MIGAENLSELPKFSVKGSKLVARRVNFTKKALDKLRSPSNGQRAYHYDTQVRGLAVAVSPAGRKTFILYRKIARRPERITIGPYPDLSIEQARGKASELNAVIAKGENPAAQKRQIRDEMTLKQLFIQFGDYYGSQKRTWLEMQREFNVYLRKWHLRKISSIHNFDVVALQTRLKCNSGLYVANHVVRLLSSVFNRAIEWGWTGKNPASHVPLFKETKRDRFLLPHEVSAFFDALRTEENETIRDFIYISLLTGARRGNIQAMTWAQLDLNSKIWTIPAANAKAEDTITVPLVAEALAILERRQKTATNGWVFPGSGRSGHLIEPKAGWKRIVKAAGLSDLRLHDLRRTLGSWEAITGASLLVIGKSLGHKNTTSTQIYARLNDSSVRESMEKAIRALLVNRQQFTAMDSNIENT